MSEVRRMSGLGRGLSALLGETDGSHARGHVQQIAIGLIERNERQPRQSFNNEALNELAASIAALGVLQPIIVQPAGGNTFSIIAGERRWRAAQQAGLHQIPAVVRTADELQTLELAIIENVQREQLNPIEEGYAYRRLVDEHGFTQDQVAKSVNKSRSHVANLIRLGELPPRVAELVTSGAITAGHARALLGLEPARAIEIAEEARKRGLSVREVEKLAKGDKPQRSPPAAANDDPDLRQLERQLGDVLGLKVAVQASATGGQVTIAYATLDQLDLICQRLTGEGRF